MLEPREYLRVKKAREDRIRSMQENIKCSSPKHPSLEQQVVIDSVKQGYNVIVNACVGSGKTTTIKFLCKELITNKDIYLERYGKILYLTFNTLLRR